MHNRLNYYRIKTIFSLYLENFWFPDDTRGSERLLIFRIRIAHSALCHKIVDYKANTGK